VQNQMNPVIAFLLLIISLPLLFCADQKVILRSTSVVAQQVRELQAKLSGNLDCRVQEDCAEAQSQREPYFNQLQTNVTQFVIEQLEAEPRLERSQLRDQLKRVFGLAPVEASGKDDRLGPYVPYVFRSPPSWASNEAGQIVWAVVYFGAVHDGMGGSRMVVDSYAVEGGRARLAGRGGLEMSDYGGRIEEIRNPSPNSLSLLIHGTLAWSSGHELPAKAILYGVSPAGVRTIWQTPTLPGLNASASPDHRGSQLHTTTRSATRLAIRKTA
jgi:hypothetical protein